MLDALITTISLDQILLGLAGHVANDATAKLTISAVKALGPALLGLIREPHGHQTVAKRRTAKPRKPPRKVRVTKCRCKQHRNRSLRGRCN